MSRSAIVTGSTGFIGGHLCQRLLSDGWQVHAIVRQDSDTAAMPDEPGLLLHRHDGTMEGLAAIIASAKPDLVFHLASLFLADHRPDQIEPLLRSNLLFPTQLLEAMVAAGVRAIINTGTAWQHHESEPYRPVNLYAATKQAMQDLLAYYTDARGISAITLKLFDTYGLGDKRRKLIRILGDAARSGESLDMSPGDQIVDLSHVDDVVSAFLVAADRLLAAEEAISEQYFVSGERCSVRELVAKVELAAGKPLTVNFGGRPYRDREVMVPIVPVPADRLPGWSPRHTLQASLSELIGA